MLLDFLDGYYQAKLHNIHDIAGNQHLVGYSELHKCNLFVKIFKNEEMFYAEQHVNQVYCPEIYLDSVIFENNYIVVLKDRTLKDIDSNENEVTLKRAKKYGRLLADFHEQVTGNVRVYENPQKLSLQIKRYVEILQDSPYKDDINKIYALLTQDLANADQDYELLPKVVLHGDYSLRNIKHYQNKEILIDFERAHIGVAYEDFIKIFYNEIHNIELRQAFIKGYRANREFEVPQFELQRCLLFLIALEICEFHMSHHEEKFGDMAHRMLETIELGDSVLNI
ncbi:aminoglycoside phosphotransferase family protein [Ligilactobacillus sp. WILCCON 0076]|uniref:Aminoglycoside phosphotransferase family protein n=1 Tax=Ligilactobacillus ubinensis TaxID=2876789 RepID=A0A9X2FL58_9LACO|nr:phosphotransferase [Ligilactobacillus ubinensis]MCP0887674.1 aminoglycoside phosphotransferase family protein [Ligilactobacillus ubinensis]